MSNDGNMLDAAQKLIEAMNRTVDENLPREIAEIVKTHSAGAAAAGVASGWIPGAGGVAAAGISAGFIWTMYGRINGKIDLPLTENVVKSLASGVATNLAAYAVGGVVVSTALSLIPGIGSVGASALVGATCYGLTLASGYVYLKILTKLFRSGRDPCSMGAEQLKKEAATVAASENIKEVMEGAKAEYKKQR